VSSEAGLPGFDTVTWFGLFASAGTPKPAIELVNRSVNDVLAAPGVKDHFAKLGKEAVGGGPDILANKVEAEMRKWASIVREKNIRIDP
jgi:tripartite-type tricarboxylate transporter receptor subunit TctC